MECYWWSPGLRSEWQGGNGAKNTDELSRNLALMGGEERKKKKVVIEGGCEARGKITET